MSSGASFLAIFSIWLLGLIVAINLLLPAAIAPLTNPSAVLTGAEYGEINNQLGIDPNESLLNYTPLGIFNFFQK